MIETFDTIIRSACIGICAIMFAHFVSIRPVSRKSVSAIAMVLGAMGMVAATSITSMELETNNYWWSVTAKIVMSVSNPLIAWGLLEIFEDDFEIRPWQLIFVGLTAPTHLMFSIHPAFITICHLSSMAIYAYICYVAFTTHKHDLVEARCIFTLWFMSATGLAGITFSAMHWTFGGDALYENIRLFEANVLLVLTIIFAYWALKVREHVWAMPHTRHRALPEKLSPAETALLQKLMASMQQNIWKQEGLTIRKLADHLHAPEHRLRKVVNQGLGYRNFAAFVNEHRIEAACEVLADPVQADVPVITIAYDVGYASLGPFNRAFREIMGESPTEFRRRTVMPA